jgi:hypothetical protein
MSGMVADRLTRAAHLGCAALLGLLLTACEGGQDPTTLDEVTTSFGKGNKPPKDPPPPPTTATVYITTSGSGAGIYHDGGPAADPYGYPYSATFNESGDLWVGAECPRAIHLDLTEGGLDAPFDAVVATCDPGNGGSSASPRITIQGLLGATVPTVLETEWVPESTNFGSAQNYYISHDDQRYNVVWRDGIHVTSVSDCQDDMKTYTISTDPDLAAAAELWTAAPKGKPRMMLVGSPDVHLDLTVVATPCPANP